jgi:hypothetical protein
MGTLTNAVVEEELQSESVAERRALIERVAASEHFRRSARLRTFLLYVGLQSLKETCVEIHEQEVGAKVFGRAASYDRSQDNIVRVNATELRKRIDAYFLSEGAHERLIFEIPRGGYKPVFRWREPSQDMPLSFAGTQPRTEAAVEHVPLGMPIAREENSWSVARWSVARWSLAEWIWPVLCLFLAAVCLLLALQNRVLRAHLPRYNQWEQEPAVAALWTDFIHGQRQTDVVLPDASVSIGEEILGQHMSLADYLNHQYTLPANGPGVSGDRRADVKAVFEHNLVAFGDFRAAQQIQSLDPAGSALHLTFSRFFTADSLKDHNAILIGGKKADPWVRMFDEGLNFSLDYDDAHSRGFITNRHPQPGEQAFYSTSMDPNGLVGYTAVAYVPNPSDTGNVIILAGTDSDATSAAAEFMTSEEQLGKLLNTLHASRFPYFEILLKTSRLSGTSFNAELIAYRTIQDEQPHSPK